LILELYLQESLRIDSEAMTTKRTATALRILTAINNRQRPEQRDVTLLRAYCPDHRNLPTDELACVVIEELLQQHRQKRKRAMGVQESMPVWDVRDIGGN
jgi:hypothetical protein